MTPKKTYTFYTDPGHGWLRVPLAEAKGLNISSCSYQDKNFAYLEEDCDAGIFLENIKDHKIIVVHHEVTFIRQLPSYTG